MDSEQLLKQAQTERAQAINAAINLGMALGRAAAYEEMAERARMEAVVQQAKAAVERPQQFRAAPDVEHERAGHTEKEGGEFH